MIFFGFISTLPSGMFSRGYCDGPAGVMLDASSDADINPSARTIVFPLKGNENVEDVAYSEAEWRAVVFAKPVAAN